MPTLTLTHTVQTVLPMAKLCRELTLCLGRRDVNPKHIVIQAMPATTFYGPFSVERPMVRLTMECNANRGRVWRNDLLGQLQTLLAKHVPDAEIFVALVPVNPDDQLTPPHS